MLDVVDGPGDAAREEYLDGAREGARDEIVGGGGLVGFGGAEQQR